MTTTTSISRPPFEWSVASRPMPGEEASGDLHVVRIVEDVALLGVVDGLGHGREAISAARCAVEILEKHATEPLITLAQRCHGALTRTRGVVMTLASLQLSKGTMSWLGVGNVEGWLFRARSDARPRSERVFLRSGVVGYQMPLLHTDVLCLAPGDTLLLATDGIRARFVEQLKLADAPSEIVRCVLSQEFKGTDDALVLAARYLGISHE